MCEYSLLCTFISLYLCLIVIVPLRFIFLFLYYVFPVSSARFSLFFTMNVSLIGTYLLLFIV